MDDWRPHGIRDSGEASGFDVLHEGIPYWLETSIWRWLMDRAAQGSMSLVQRAERRLHIRITDANEIGVGRYANELIAEYWKNGSPEERLRLLDFCLWWNWDEGRTAAKDYARQDEAKAHIASAIRLDTILAEGGSAWAVHQEAPYWSLVRRVNHTTAELVRTVTTAEGDAAKAIGRAWHACYRHEPDYDVAYRRANLAVEAVVIPATIPDSPRASLGQAARHIEDTAPHWTVGTLDATEIQSVDTLTSMLRTLWHNQERHAQGDGTITGVTREEAEAAVSLAVLVVHWFSSGLVTRDDR